MDKKTTRQFSPGQMRSSKVTTRMLTTLKRDPNPHNFLSVDRFNVQDHSPKNKDIDDQKAAEGLKVDHNEEKVASLSTDANDSGFVKGGIVEKESDRTRSLPRTLFIRRSDQSPRYDIGLSVRRHRSPQEINSSKQSQFISNPLSVPNRRMSSPGKILSSSSNEESSASTRIVTALERQTNRLITQSKHPLQAEKESRDALPKITKSIEALTTGDHTKRSKSLEEGRKSSIKTSKWSPQSLSSDKSWDRSQGLLEAKIIPESRVTTPQTPILEGAMESQSKIVQSSRLDCKEAENTLPIPIDIVSGYSSWKAKAVRDDKRDYEGPDLVQSSGCTDKFKNASCEEKKRRSPRRRVTLGSKVIDYRPKSKISPQKYETAASDEPFSATNPENELLDLKVKAFLRKHQPKASPGTLKVKASKVKKSMISPNKLRERRSQDKIFVNTDTCPSSNLVNQDRSWYYQDRKGKCRYLRVPESPVPPIEWVFKRSSSP